VHVAYIGDDQHEQDENAGLLHIPVREARKRFQQFLRTETRSLGSDEPYSAQLMRQQGAHRSVDVDLKDLKNYDGALGQQLEEKPNTYLPLARLPSAPVHLTAVPAGASLAAQRPRCPCQAIKHKLQKHHHAAALLNHR
jgi:MCM N-terminal domain